MVFNSPAHPRRMQAQEPSVRGARSGCKHSVDLAEVVVEAEIFPSILMCLKDVDGFVRAPAAIRGTPSTLGTGATRRLQRQRRRAGRLRGRVREQSPAGRHGAGVHHAFGETLATAVPSTGSRRSSRRSWRPRTTSRRERVEPGADWPAHAQPRQSDRRRGRAHKRRGGFASELVGGSADEVRPR